MLSKQLLIVGEEEGASVAAVGKSEGALGAAEGEGEGFLKRIRCQILPANANE